VPEFGLANRRQDLWRHRAANIVVDDNHQNVMDDKHRNISFTVEDGELNECEA